MAVAGWLGAPYLSEKWVADGYLRKQQFVVSTGAWANEKYLSKKWIAATWVHYAGAGTGAAVSAQNVPGVALAVLPGSALQTTKVNATEPALPLAALLAHVNASTKVTQANVPGLALAAFNGTTNGSVYQIGNVTFTIEVASTFRYVDAVNVSNVPGLALAAITAIVTEGTNINVAATKVILPLVALAASVKANTSTRAVASVGVALQAYDAAIAVGKMVFVDPPLAVPLSVIPVAVTAADFNPNYVFATRAALLLGVFDATVHSVQPQSPYTYNIVVKPETQTRPILILAERTRLKAA